MTAKQSFLDLLPVPGTAAAIISGFNGSTMPCFWRCGVCRADAWQQMKQNKGALTTARTCYTNIKLLRRQWRRLAVAKTDASFTTIMRNATAQTTTSKMLDQNQDLFYNW